ncbi:MAG: hypothetical protein P8I99_15375 [Acidimicrobiales bacterium]|nr:hypothetical protein [Acidimicrobiales bacterium]
MPNRLKWGMWRFRRVRIDHISDPLTQESCHEIIATVAFRAKHARHRFGDISEHGVVVIDAVEATLRGTAGEGAVVGRETKTCVIATIAMESMINS